MPAPAVAQHGEAQREDAVRPSGMFIRGRSVAVHELGRAHFVSAQIS